MLKASIYGVVAFLIVGVLGIYYFNFNVQNVYSLSNQQGDWASFGSYFGGVIGPILAFLVVLPRTTGQSVKSSLGLRS